MFQHEIDQCSRHLHGVNILTLSYFRKNTCQRSTSLQQFHSFCYCWISLSYISFFVHTFVLSALNYIGFFFSQPIVCCSFRYFCIYRSLIHVDDQRCSIKNSNPVESGLSSSFSFPFYWVYLVEGVDSISWNHVLLCRSSIMLLLAIAKLCIFVFLY